MAIEKVMVDSVGNTTKYHRLNEAKFIFDSNQLTLTISSYSDEEYRNLEKLEISDIESAIARSRELFSKTELTDDEKNELKQIVSTLNPGGPKYNYFWGMRLVDNLLYTCGGGFGHIVDANRPGTIQVLNGDEWQIYEDDIQSQTGVKYIDMNSVDVDPLDPSHVFGGARSGLYEFKNGKFVNFYNSDNSLITSFNGSSKNYQIIGSVKFDQEGNLWMVNCQSPANQSLIEFSKEEEWISHHKTELYKDQMSLGSMECLTFDSSGLLWFVNNHPNYPSLVCYQISTDGIKVYNSFINQDGTKIEPYYVRYVAEDKNHDIWVATSLGPLLLQRKELTADSPVFIQVKVPRNDGTNFADYLLSGIDISCIAIDGGNRKWFGTNTNGVYVISNDCMTQVHHFTSNNSKLLSNNIESIAINEQTGEVFIGTDKGLCSYISEAGSINREMTKDNVWAYPNPVKPDYTGLITITGLSFDADVKIVTSNGSLVNQGRSTGGTYTWNGKDLKGKRVASGIYMVETATNDGSKGTVCKIAIIN